ncbi:Caffeic acid 3-O-methyltransferase 2 [Sesamum angolense]|uniref:Caffeic acid 3-O-methyltransferase 2 n=1 Tax=Sesamum angolense TaxID=2727404 RepID=A0AAE1WB66_9LAMI|nr:Caffeic acid 3-O-methyltransferase 2 [Sesamum angolense]
MERIQTNSPILAIMELVNLVSVPMSLNAVIKLKVLDKIWHDGSNNPLSAAEILSAIAVGPAGDAENLQRILRLLTSYGVFDEHIGKDGERRFSLTEVGKALAADENGLSYAPYVLQHHQDALMLAWPRVHEAVLDPSSEPFVKVHGELPYSYYGKNPEMNLLMQKAMSGVSVPFMEAFLDRYDGFQGVETLVDVGGNSGDCLRLIMNKYQSIEHVGGDLLKSNIPPSDAIFMKAISGAVMCLSVELGTKGKHRTESEYRALGIAAGFSNLKANFKIDNYFTVLEFEK